MGDAGVVEAAHGEEGDAADGGGIVGGGAFEVGEIGDVEEGHHAGVDEVGVGVVVFAEESEERIGEGGGVEGWILRGEFSEGAGGVEADAEVFVAEEAGEGGREIGGIGFGGEFGGLGAEFGIGVGEELGDGGGGFFGGNLAEGPEGVEAGELVFVA